MRVVHGVFAALFVLGAVVQLNDPDPLRWVVIYLAAAAVALVGRRWRAASGGVAVIAMVWAVTIAAGGMEPLALEALFGDATMKTVGVEAWRELLGLGLIAVYCLTCVLRPALPASDGA